MTAARAEQAAADAPHHEIGEIPMDDVPVFAKPDFKAVAKQISIPLIAMALLLVFWHWWVVSNEIPPYILPSPLLVIETLFSDWRVLSEALIVTLWITFGALTVALIGGVLMAILFAQSRLAELAFYPYAVILQVTPIIAIAPLLIIYAPNTETVLLMCAFLVAFFPILSNTVQGLRSTDHNLMNLFELYGASSWQMLMLLKIPNSLPHFTTGFTIGGTLALIGATVAEFTAGAAGAKAGLAFRILEAGRRLNVPRLFAALILITLTGLAIWFVTRFISHLLLRKWHESAMKREN
jgi:NitT/TauT family transport system permease protein